ncbi:MAG: fumarylacetoacetate hydrolase family protein, partial [Alphaproteobacteria bacterium]|nr:fumarylacetoacetate hydrolase family protein [Alphaproteobacteria bacterium]
RYADNQLGLVRDDMLSDATAALKNLPPLTWPTPLGDHLIANLDALRPAIERAADDSDPVPVSSVVLKSPVANPSKIIGAPVNYQKHHEEAVADQEINRGRDVKTIDTYGLFMKANSSLVGPGEGVALRFTDRRNDHEVELAVIIGEGGSDITEADAMGHICAYSIGLDMTVRGTEDRSLRKGIDTYSVLGPWLVTADEIADPGHLDFEIRVNDELRQKSNTEFLIFDIPRLIAYASSFMTLYPGDVIMTGTPEGVGPVVAGDVMHAWIDGVGEMSVPVRAHE